MFVNAWGFFVRIHTKGLHRQGVTAVCLHDLNSIKECTHMNATELVAAQMQREAKCTHQPAAVLRALLAFGIGESRLASQLGVTVSLVSLWKRGERPIAEHWQGELYALLREFIASKQATIALLKEQGVWDRQMSRLLRDRFAEASKVYSNRPRWVRELEGEQDVA